MGILNDIAKRDLRGDVRLEDRCDIYFQNKTGDVKVLKRGTYHEIHYVIMTSGDYPFIDIMIPTGKKDDYRGLALWDPVNTLRRYIQVENDIDGCNNLTIVYNTWKDYVVGYNSTGKMHTLESLVADAEMYIQQILKKNIKKFKINLHNSFFIVIFVSRNKKNKQKTKHYESLHCKDIG